MKRIIFLLVLSVAITAANAQNFDNSCTVERFPYALTYAQLGGFGAELGTWPQDALIGAAFGITYTNDRTVKKTVRTESGTTTVNEWHSTVYTKGILRLNRYCYVTGLLGAYDLTDGYYGIGTRLSVPVGRGTLCTMAFEPQYTTRGANILAGLGFALTP